VTVGSPLADERESPVEARMQPASRLGARHMMIEAKVT
jgi:hypothetical protein